MVDYSLLKTNVKKKIDKYGRTVTFNKRDRTASTSSEPWKARSTTNNVSVSIKALEVEFIQSEISMYSIPEGSKKLLINAVDLTNAGDYDTVTDGEEYRIARVLPVAPGDTDVMYEVHLIK